MEFKEKFGCVILGTLLGFYLLIALIVATVCFISRRNDSAYNDYPVSWVEHFVMDGLTWPITVLTM